MSAGAEVEAGPLVELVDGLSRISGIGEDLIFVIDRRMQVRYLRTSSAMPLGATPRQAVGKRIGEIFPWSSAALEENLNSVFVSVSHLCSEDLFTVSERELWLDTRLSPITDGSGEVVAVLGISRDITDRKRIEGLIVRSKQEWLRAIDTIPYLLAVVDNQHHIRRINRAMADKLSISVRDATGMVCYEKLHGMGRPPAHCPVKMSRNGRERMIEQCVKQFGGEYLVSVSSLCGAAGESVGCVYIARSLIRSGTSMEVRRKDEECMRLMMMNADYVIAVQSKDGNYLSLNALPGDSSTTAGNACGKTPYDFFAPEVAEKIVERVKQVAATGTEMSFSNKLTWGDEAVHFFEQVSPIWDSEQHIKAIMTISRRTGPEKSDSQSTVNLTRRESEILNLISSGLTNSQIAASLFISKHTVETHRARLMRKLDIHKASALVKYAMKAGLFEK